MVTTFMGLFYLCILLEFVIGAKYRGVLNPLLTTLYLLLLIGALFPRFVIIALIPSYLNGCVSLSTKCSSSRLVGSYSCPVKLV